MIFSKSTEVSNMRLELVAYCIHKPLICDLCLDIRRMGK